MTIEEWDLDLNAMSPSVAPEAAKTVLSSGYRKVFGSPAVDNVVRLKARV
jgi:hypothetical protein